MIVIKPLIKYPGGKEKELKYIVPLMPSYIEKYYEPFLGGGAVFFGIDNYTTALINDKSDELINFYRVVSFGDKEYIEYLLQIDRIWRRFSSFVDNNSESILSLYKGSCSIDDFLHNNRNKIYRIFKGLFINNSSFLRAFREYVPQKTDRIRANELASGDSMKESEILKNMECAFKSAIYNEFRFEYNKLIKNKSNNSLKAALYLFQREYCYSSMFRYNSFGEFNVPYGGISYNRKNLTDKIEQIISNEYINKLRFAYISCNDFYSFMKQDPPKRNDFVFIDPPYDTEFSSYSGNDFTKDDQVRLAEYLIKECEGKWMIVIKSTDFIRSLYTEGSQTINGGCISVKGFDKKYMVSFMNRNQKDCTHLIITNYSIE